MKIMSTEKEICIEMIRIDLAKIMTTKVMNTAWCKNTRKNPQTSIILTTMSHLPFPHFLRTRLTYIIIWINNPELTVMIVKFKDLEWGNKKQEKLYSKFKMKKKEEINMLMKWYIQTWEKIIIKYQNFSVLQWMIFELKWSLNFTFIFFLL